MTIRTMPLAEFLGRAVNNRIPGALKAPVSDGDNPISRYQFYDNQLWDHNSPLVNGRYSAVTPQSIMGSADPQKYLESLLPDGGKSMGMKYDPATGNVTYDQNDDDGFGEWLGVLGTFAGMAAGGGGLNGLLGGAGAGAAGEIAALTGSGGAGGAGVGGFGGFGGSVLGGQSSGGGMWDWLDSIIESGNLPDSGAENFFGFEGGGGPLMPPAIPETPAQLTEWGMKEVSPGVWELPSLPGSSFDFGSAKNLIQKGLEIAKGLGGVLGGSGMSGGNNGGFGGGLLGTAFNATPFLLALSEANKQGKDLDGVINKINGEGYTKAVLNPYDLQTGLGRGAMENDLGLRGVAGSSFGYQALDNYDYTRALGRGDLASKALMTSAGLEGSLINTRNTNRNLLLGAGLNASGRLFQPQRDPFGLSLLGA